MGEKVFIDSNIFLEIFLKDNKSEECEKFRINKKRNFEYLDGKKFSSLIKMCGDGLYQIRAKFFYKKNFADLKNKLKKIGKLIDFGHCINFNNSLTIFQDGRALIKAKDENEAKSLYSRFVGN